MIVVEFLSRPNRNHDMFVTGVVQCHTSQDALTVAANHFSNHPHAVALRIDGVTVGSIKAAAEALDAGLVLREVCYGPL